MARKMASSVTAVIATIVMSAPMLASAKEKSAPRSSAAVLKLAGCRDIADDAQRLACFDREVAAFDTAVKQRKVAVVDQEEIRKTRRTLFGIPLPNIKLFGDNDDEPEIKQVTSTIKSTSRGEGGRIIFILEDGAVWAQTDDYPVFYNVKPGQKVTLKRASLGSYFADFEKATSVRAKRLR